jgi:nucleolar protein 4
VGRAYLLLRRLLLCSSPPRADQDLPSRPDLQTTEATLNRLFIPYGPIHAVTLPPPVVKEGAKPRARGFAFVHMLTRKDAERAMEGVNGTTVFGEDNVKAIVLEGEERKGGREVAVDWALSRDKWEKEKAEETVAEPAEAEEEEGDAEEDAEDAASGSGEDAEMDDGTILAPASDGDDSEEEEEEATPALPPPSEQTTLFVRNLSFEVTEDQLRTLYVHLAYFSSRRSTTDAICASVRFRTFGPLRYARITMDKATNRSRGTGFVCFWKKEDAEKAIEEASMLAAETGGSGANAIVVKDRTTAANPFTLNSVLTADPSSSLAQNMTLNGRVLDVNWAVTREQAGALKEENDRRKEKVDKRNTYLMREGGEHESTSMPRLSTRTLTSAAYRQSSLPTRRPHRPCIRSSSRSGSRRSTRARRSCRPIRRSTSRRLVCRSGSCRSSAQTVSSSGSLSTPLASSTRRSRRRSVRASTTTRSATARSALPSPSRRARRRRRAKPSATRSSSRPRSSGRRTGSTR